MNLTIGEAMKLGRVTKAYRIVKCPSCGNRYQVEVYRDTEGQVVLIDGPLECYGRHPVRLGLEMGDP